MSLSLPTPDTRSHASLNERSVLFVADSADDVSLALRAFREAGFPHEVVVARGAEEARDYLFCGGRYAGRDRLIAPLMVVIDLTIPRLSGMELLKRIRGDRALRYVVTVLLTASGEETARLKRVSQGHDLFAEKPRDIAGFLVMARQMTSLLSHLAP